MSLSSGCVHVHGVHVLDDQLSSGDFHGRGGRLGCGTHTQPGHEELGDAGDLTGVWWAVDRPTPGGLGQAVDEVIGPPNGANLVVCSRPVYDRVPFLFRIKTRSLIQCIVGFPFRSEMRIGHPIDRNARGIQHYFNRHEEATMRRTHSPHLSILCGLKTTPSVHSAGQKQRMRGHR